MPLRELLDASTPLESVLAHRPALLEKYRAFHFAACTAGGLDARTLELARLRIAAIHDCEAEWRVRSQGVALDDRDEAALRRGDLTHFAENERVVLELAERIPHAHHAMQDEDLGAVARCHGARGAAAVLTAICFFDALARLKLVFSVAARDLVRPAPDTGPHPLA